MQWVRFIRKKRDDGVPIVEYMPYKPGRVIELEDIDASIFKFEIIEVTDHQSSLDYLRGV